MQFNKNYQPILPWVECLSFDAVDHVVRGLERWADSTLTACVLTHASM